MLLGWVIGCAFIPADYAETFALAIPFPAPAPDCVRAEADGPFEITQAWIDEQCVCTTVWRGELLDLEGVRAAVEAQAAEYRRDLDQVRRTVIQQLDYEIVSAELDFGTEVVVYGRVDLVPDEPADEVLAVVLASTPDPDWLAAGSSAGTDAGPSRNRTYYEPGSNAILDALTARYVLEEPFTGQVIAEMRLDPSDVDLLSTQPDRVLAVQARIALGATFWVRIP